MPRPFTPLALVTTIACALLLAAATTSTGQDASPAAGRTAVSYSDATPVFAALRDDLLPVELRGKTSVEREAIWPTWLSRRDAAIRARVEDGDADAIINLLQFGTAFTTEPRITEREPAGVLVRQAGTGATAFLPSPVLRARIADFVSALAAPGRNERLQFARTVIERTGMTLTTEAGTNRIRRYLEERTSVVGNAPHASTLVDPNADLRTRTTIFSDRGLASDTAIWIDFGIERALEAAKSRGLLQPGSVHRVGVLGPGLDFSDKQEGYDFYPEQSIQPFALVDSLSRLGLSASSGVRVDALDLSPRVIGHLDAARMRARAGVPYTLVLPRNLAQPWTADLVRYWEGFGDRIGVAVQTSQPPTTAGRVAVRSVRVRPAVAASLFAHDVNIVVQRLESLAEADRFDLIVASNILIYYDVFEQSLAAANLAAMLRPGGLLFSNDRIFELPGGPVVSAGHTDVTYMQVPDGGQRGDRIEWYQRR